MAEAKQHRACPVWIGYLLASPIRTLFQNPHEILAPYLTPGARVLEVGPGMGFFTLPMARLIGPEGRVFSVDVQEKMLAGLMGRARRAKLAGRIEARVCDPESLGVADLAGTIDFALAFAVVHEIGDAARFFGEVQEVLKPRGLILFAEPTGHVTADAFEESLSAARRCGLEKVEPLKIARSHAAVLRRA